MSETQKDQGGVELISLADLLGEDIGGGKDDTISLEALENANTDNEDNSDKGGGENKGDSSLNLEDKADDTAGDGKGENSEKHQNTKSDVSEQLRSTLKNLFGIDKIKQDIDGAEVELSIDEIDMDAETYEMIVKQVLEEQKEEANRDKVSIKGMPDLVKSIIDIGQAGGDVTKVLRMQEAWVNPLDQLDLTQRQDQIDAIYLRQKAKGLEDDEINIIIQGYDSKGLLEEKAQQADSELRAAFQAQVDKEKQKAQDEAKEREEQMKNYRKELKENIGTSFQVNDTLKAKLVEFSTKKGNDGKYEVDKAFMKSMADPKLASELIMLLYDREEFLKQVSNKKVQEAKLETAKTIKTIRSSGGTATKDPLRKKEEDIIKFTDL